MIRPLVVALALMAARGAQSRITATLVVRTPGAAAGDSALVASAVTRAFAAVGITVVAAAPATARDPHAPGATYLVEVTAKAMRGVGLIDLRAIDPKTGALMQRVSRRAFAAALPDSAAIAARELAATMIEARKAARPKRGGPVPTTARTPRRPESPSS